jgi:hypothetical protein
VGGPKYAASSFTFLRACGREREPVVEAGSCGADILSSVVESVKDVPAPIWQLAMSTQSGSLIAAAQVHGPGFAPQK